MGFYRRKICKISLIFFIGLFFLAGLLVYFHYIDLKKTLILQLTSKATEYAGQPVILGDISFTPAGGLNLDGIEIKNPPGFSRGEFLKIKEININPDLHDLLRGKLHFGKITVSSPSISLIKDDKGKFNISPKLIAELSKKSDLKYVIDRVSIASGELNADIGRKYMLMQIDTTIDNISTDISAKTLIKAEMNFEGAAIKTDGWAYLREPQKRFAVSFIGSRLPLSFLIPEADIRKFVSPDASLDMSVDANGDIDKGVAVKISSLLRGVGSDLSVKNNKDILVSADAFIDPGKILVTLNNGNLKIGDVSSVRFKGSADNLLKEPSYSFDIALDRFDLSSLKLLKDYRFGGLVSSDNLKIAGKAGAGLPRITGTVSVQEGLVQSKTEDINHLETRIVFSYERMFSVGLDSMAEISMLQGRKLKTPVKIASSITAKGVSGQIDINAKVKTSAVDMLLDKGKTFHLDDAGADLNGILKGREFAGKISLDVGGIGYDAVQIKTIKASADLQANTNRALIKKGVINSDIYSLLFDSVNLDMSKKKEFLKLDIIGLSATYSQKKAFANGMDINLELATINPPEGRYLLSAAEMRYQDVPLSKGLKAHGTFSKDLFRLDDLEGSISGGSVKATGEGHISEKIFPIKMTVDARDIDTGIISKTAADFIPFLYDVSGRISAISFSGVFDSADAGHGHFEVKADGLTITDKKQGKKLISDLALSSHGDLEGPDTDISAQISRGKMLVSLSGNLKNVTKKERELSLKASCDPVDVSYLREVFWDMVPDTLLYAGLEGSLSSDIKVSYGQQGLAADGALRIKDFLLTGENNQYVVGPISGELPFSYKSKGNEPTDFPVIPFERDNFDRLSDYYKNQADQNNIKEVRIGSIRYGFKFLDDVKLNISATDGVLKIDRFSANIFEGKINGTAAIDISGNSGYRAGMILEGMSLSKLCDEIEPIRGYISGRVNGILEIKGSGLGIAAMIGKADIWTYSTANEKTRVSREFLKKMGGPSIKSYIGDRSFNKGIANLYIMNGYMVMRELEISNRNFFGMKDLSVSVAPLNNRILIDHLLSTITEAAQRANKE